MKFETLSVFPEVFDSYVNASILGRAKAEGIWNFQAYNLRDWTHDRHKTVDDAPYGGGQGMLMKPAPIFEAVRAIYDMDEALPHVVFFTPQGTPFNQKKAEELIQHERVLFVCGRYEGMDERVYSLADECISLGDYVLTGGELAALTVIDACVRLLPGALGDEMSPVDESFQDGLLEYAQYTRPQSFEGMEVPEVLLSGNHQKIAEWRRQNALERTAKLRPELLETADLSETEKDFVEKLLQEDR